MLLMTSAFTRALPRHPAVRLSRACAHHKVPICPAVRHASSTREPDDPRIRRQVAFILGILGLGIAAGATAWTFSDQVQQPTGPEKAEIKFEKSRKRAASSEETRDIVSSQHLQVKRSWERPGVYAWGSNTGRVAAPDSSEPVVKTPRRIPYFEGQILRDLKLDRDFGVAVTETGDLVQWGLAFSKDKSSPMVTLKGKDITKVTLSRDRIIALSSNGSVYSIPVSLSEQTKVQQSSSCIPFWSNPPPPVNYRSLIPSRLGWAEKVVDVRSGLDHCLMMTNKGRLFSAASSSESFPDRGQLGVPGLRWETRPDGPFDQPHEIDLLRAFTVKAIAAGDFHSLVLDGDGRIFSFGDNSTGQLGFRPEPETPCVDSPTLLPLGQLYSRTGLLPRATSIAAGGCNTFFTVDATQTQLGADPDGTPAKLIADTWACGEGVKGSLGTGRWTHISTLPTKIKTLSNLFEWDEKNNKAIPIRLSHISVGSTHAAAIMDNLTYLDSSQKSSDHDTNWGADIVWWGGNEHYQLGTGKRNNINTPTYIAPLDGGAADADMGKKGEMHRFQITPRKTVRLGERGNGRKVSVEQRVECGRNVTAVYSGA